jgi:hypothetical protein
LGYARDVDAPIHGSAFEYPSTAGFPSITAVPHVAPSVIRKTVFADGRVASMVVPSDYQE